MNKIREFARLLSHAERAVVFTGAGMSTASGLPDFRSGKGLWKRFDPSRLASVKAMDSDPKSFQAFYRMRIQALGKARPNCGHEVLARWEEEGRIRGVITQNVDGFHQEAGSRNVFDLHGSLRRVFCRNCLERYPSAELVTRGDCPQCGGLLRPGVVLFGEELPRDAFESAGEMTRECDLFVVLGSSLTVSPANGFPRLARSCGARLVIVNREETPLDGLADLGIDDDIGAVLARVDSLLHAE